MVFNPLDEPDEFGNLLFGLHGRQAPGPIGIKFKIKDLEIAQPREIIGLSAPVLTDRKNIESHHFSRLNAFFPHYQLAPGRLTFHNHKQDKLTYFSLGGKLAMRSDKSGISGVIESSAPFLRASHDPFSTSFQVFLVEEIEDLLAELRAGRLPHGSAFEFALCQYGPNQLYAACLISLENKFADNPHYQEDQQSRAFTHLVRAEIDDMVEHHLWPQNSVSLEGLLRLNNSKVPH